MGFYAAPIRGARAMSVQEELRRMNTGPDTLRYRPVEREGAAPGAERQSLVG